MSEYRFYVGANGTIQRGRAYRLPEGFDVWEHYWDGDHADALLVDGWRERPIILCQTANDYAGRLFEAIKRGMTPDQCERWVRMFVPVECYREDCEHGHTARLLQVSVARGDDVWQVIDWPATDEDVAEVRDSIEAHYTGDIWRIEVQEYQPDEEFQLDDEHWTYTDDVCEEWIGTQIEAAFEREFPLAEFPAERLTNEGA